MVTTVHGNNLNNLIKDPAMNPLVGGIHSVTLGDAAARYKYKLFSFLFFI